MKFLGLCDRARRSYRATACWRAAALAVFGLALAPSAATAQGGSVVDRPPAEARVPGLEVTDGVFRIPSAYIQRSGEITAFAAGDKSVGGGVLLGLGQRLELGIAAGDPEHGFFKIVGSAKLDLLPEALLAPAVAVGILDVSNTSREGRSEYVVVSKYVIPYFVESVSGLRDIALKFHVGYGTGLYRNQAFVGAEIWEAHGFGALGEVAAGRPSVGARYCHNGIGVTAGLLEVRRVGGSVSYTISVH